MRIMIYFIVINIFITNLKVNIKVNSQILVFNEMYNDCKFKRVNKF